MRNVWIVVAIGLGFVFPSFASGDVVLFEDFSYGTQDYFEANWSPVETGDEEMAWALSAGTIDVRNSSSSGGNDQTVIFGRRIDTAGYESIHVSLSYWANAEDVFEITDFIRI